MVLSILRGGEDRVGWGGGELETWGPPPPFLLHFCVLARRFEALRVVGSVHRMRTNPVAAHMWCVVFGVGGGG